LGNNGGRPEWAAASLIGAADKRRSNREAECPRRIECLPSLKSQLLSLPQNRKFEVTLSSN
jgi:hypothetical protein